MVGSGLELDAELLVSAFTLTAESAGPDPAALISGEVGVGALGARRAPACRGNGETRPSRDLGLERGDPLLEARGVVRRRGRCRLGGGVRSGPWPGGGRAPPRPTTQEMAIALLLVAGA